jgi:crossover junction endodeoxyribonuclease RusA
LAVIELPFPAKILWPNGRGHWAAKAKAFKDHKGWAHYRTRCFYHDGNKPAIGERIDWSVTIHPKTAHAIDDDNARASLKAYQDGLALALGVDDKQFNAPSLTFGEPIKGGLVRIVIAP